MSARPLRHESGRLDIHAAGVSDTGGRAANEDAYFIGRVGPAVQALESNLDASPTFDPACTLLAVADGMGGHRDGRLASRTALHALVAGTLAFPDPAPSATSATSADLDALAEALDRLITRCASAVDRTAPAGSPSGRGGRAPGTTLTSLHIRPPSAVLAHVGDSRCYLLRDGELHQLTVDHTIAEAMRVAGNAPPEFAGAMLTSALGGGVDDPERQIARVQLRAHDRLLLCTDGLYEALDEGTITEILGEGEDPKATSWRLYGAACERDATDNVTAVVAHVRPATASEHVVSTVYEDAKTARAALDALLDAHFSLSDISVLGRDADQVAAMPVAVTRNIERTVALGGAVGVVAGGVGGVLAAIGALPIGLGLVAAGPVVAALESAVVLGGLGTLAGAVAGLGYTHEEIQLSDVDLEEGRVWIGVHCGSRSRAIAARVAMAQAGGTA